MSDDSNTVINMYGGQMNLASGNANINAMQNNSKNEEKLDGKIITFSQDITYTNYFLGRENEIDKILRAIKKNERILISGVGGIGKTTISKHIFHYLKNNCNEGTKLGYFNYELSLEETIYKALCDNSVGDKSVGVKKAWNDLEKIMSKNETIIIIDNIPFKAYEDIKKLNVLTGKIIITSRQNLYDNYETIEIKELELEQCIELFIRNSGLSKDEIDSEYLTYIIDNLVSRHTLTIELLAKITRKKTWTIEKLKTELERIKFKIAYKENGEFKSLLSEYKKIYSISALEEYEKNILEGFSLLRKSKLDVDTCLLYFSKDANDCVSENLNELYEMGWLQRTKAYYSIHPIYAEFICESERPSVSKHTNLYNFFDNISNDVKDNKLINIQKHLTSLISFAKFIHLDIDSGLDNLENTMINIADYAQQCAEYHNSIFILKRITKTYKNNYIKANIILGDVYTKISLFNEAERSFNEVKQLIENSNNNNILYIEYIINYALYLEKKSKNDIERREAIDVLENIVDISMDESKKATIYNCLGGFYTNLKHNKENLGIAMDYHKKAEKIRKKYAELNITDLARTYNNIANVHYYLSKINDVSKDENLTMAEDFYNRSLNLRKQTYGDVDHPDIARIFVNLGNVYIEQGLFPDAQEVMCKGLKIRIDFLGEKTKEIGITYSNLVTVYTKLNDREQAEFCDKKAKEIYKHLYTEDSDDYREICNKHKKLLSELK